LRPSFDTTDLIMLPNRWKWKTKIVGVFAV
jgi:hypothetical protein